MSTKMMLRLKHICMLLDCQKPVSLSDQHLELLCSKVQVTQTPQLSTTDNAGMP